MAEPPRGRGRARGRAREQYRERSRYPPPSEPSTSSAWSQRPSQPSRPHAPSTPYVRPQQVPQSVGHATRRPEPSRDVVGVRQTDEPMDTSPAIGGGGDASSLGRGSSRGRRILPADLLVTRPQHLLTKKGETGQPVRLLSNYFKLISSTDWCLYKYAVDFAPEEDRTFVRKGLLRLHKEKFGAYIFDGSVMYTSNKLPETMELFSIRQSDNVNIRIVVKFVEEMARGDYHYLQFFNIIMRKCLTYLKLELIGRNYFDPQLKIEISDYKIELWPGYFTSIRQHEKDILLCAEITHKVLRQDSILEILRNIRRESPDNYQDRFRNSILGQTVLTQYNNNTYVVDDVDFNVSPLSTFRLRNGEEITYKDYYKQRYEIRINDNHQPMLLTKSKPKDRRAGKAELVYLVPELCRATGLTDQMREDFRLMRVMSDYTRVAPQDRMERLMRFHGRLRSTPQVLQEFKEWNLELDNKLLEIPARILPPERISFGTSVTTDGNKDADWSQELRSKALLKSLSLSDWIIIYPYRAKHDIEQFLSNLIRVSAGMKFVVKQPRQQAIEDDRSGTYAQILENILSHSRPQMVFCIVSNNRSERYSAIKKKCCVDRPVPSQVFLQKNLRGSLSIATKVAIQINCKLGGAPWCVEIPLQGLMIVGFDVCHDPQNKGRDFGAMVASLDKYHTRYFSVVNVHSSGEELSNHIAMNLVLAVQKYRSVNNALPERIVIYRDGVGEGQISYVHDYEVQHVQSELMKVYGDKPLKMAFIIVTKRIKTRLFFNRNNAPPGTVVDDVITNPVKYDFFIVSQRVRQGTVTPTYYSVINDSSGITADRIQRLTYKLTHMYYNWSGTVRVPAPCQYAHKLAFLVSQFIHRVPSTQLDTLLYFL